MEDKSCTLKHVVSGERNMRKKELKHTASMDPYIQNSMKLIEKAAVGQTTVKTIRRENQSRECSEYQELVNYMNFDYRRINNENISEHILYDLYGILDHKVILSKGWSKEGFLPMMVRDSENLLTTVIPIGRGRYRYYNYENKRYEIVTKTFENSIDEEAVSYYLPFLEGSKGKKGLLSFFFKAIGVIDLVILLLMTFLKFGTNALLPFTTKYIFEYVVVEKNMSMLLSVGFFLMMINLTTTIFFFLNQIVIQRINRKLGVISQAAAVGRVLSTSISSFKKFTTGEMIERVNGVMTLYETGAVIFVTMLYFFIGAGTSLTALSMIAKPMLLPTVLIVFASALVTAVAVYLNQKNETKKLEINSRISDFALNMMRGVSKLKTSGSTNRGFARWMDLFSEKLEIEISISPWIKYFPILIKAIGVMGMMILYYFAVQNSMSGAEFIAFQVAYAEVMSEVVGFTTMALDISKMKPHMSRTIELLNLPQDVGELQREEIANARTDIELKNIDFRYNKEDLLFKDFSLKIAKGDYVAIVGPSGSGKSTLVQLLMGFENMERGNIYYERQELKKIRISSLLRHVSVIQQNVQMMNGTIIENLQMLAPETNETDAWEALKKVGIAAYIQSLPDQLQTRIGEGAMNLSGGQNQQL